MQSLTPPLVNLRAGVLAKPPFSDSQTEDPAAR